MAERDQALALARKAGAITALSAANRAAMEFFHEPLLADLPDFAAWPAFRSQAAGVKLIDNKMRWRERWLQRILIRKLALQLAGSLREDFEWVEGYFLIPVMVRSWMFLRRFLP
jgi:hypothetical protein